MSLAQEFKEFINRGNVVDMAVGIIVGSSFVKIVDSLVNFLFNPIIGLLIGGVNLSRFSFTIREGAVIEYGIFFNSVLDFFIVAFSVFLFVKMFNSLKRRYLHQPAPSKQICSFCKSEISSDATRCPFCTSNLAKN